MMAWLVLLLPVLITFMGLVLDGSLLLLRAQMLDAATDAATLAAIDAWDREYWRSQRKVRIDPAGATSRARDYLAKNMPDARLEQVTVNPANQVKIRTSTTVPLFFLRIIGWKEKKVESYAAAVVQSKK